MKNALYVSNLTMISLTGLIKNEKNTFIQHKLYFTTRK